MTVVIKPRKLKKTGLISSIFLLGIALISGCDRPFQFPGNAAIEIVEINPIEPPEMPEPSPYTTEAKLIAVGDIMMHGSQIKSGYNSQTKTYSYETFFREVKDIFSAGDWVIGNLETTLAGAEAKYTGYPRFNAPAELADAIKEAGFNILTTANNHSLDRNEKGVLKTLENVKQRGLLPVGTAASQEESEEILIVEKNEISMAILAYTYGTNGIPIPKGKDYLVNLIKEEEIVKDILEARQLGADIVTVALHFGSEYQRQPNAQQKQLVEVLIKAGADIILGSHPHVVQPYQIFEVAGEGGKIRKAVAIYSMGNFISNQRGNYKDLGVIFEANIQKNFPEETVEIVEVKALPTWVHRYSENGKWIFRVLPLEKVLAAKNDPLLGAKDYQLLETYLERMESHVNSFNN
jgi:poly-gamma-glutamate synthesis protein (capsule biosynthesis protein)